MKHNKEWKILEFICTSGGAADFGKHFTAILKDGVFWGELIEQAVRHKLLPTLGYYVCKYGKNEQGEFASYIPVQIGMHLEEAFLANRHKALVFKMKVREVASFLCENSIPFVCTKGLVLDATIYEEEGVRNFCVDVDFMIRQQDMAKVEQGLKHRGFEYGYYDHFQDKVAPFARQEMVLYRMNPDHLPPMSIGTHDAIYRGVTIDFSSKFTWHNSDFEVNQDDAFKENVQILLSRRIENSYISSFSPRYQFLFVLLHLFREAWFERWMEFENDVNLMKFSDIVRLWRHYQLVLKDGIFWEIVQKNNIEMPVLWVLQHLDGAFSLNILDDLGIAERVSDAWLSSTHQSSMDSGDGWDGNMRDRLAWKDRKDFLTRK
ncbi:nucleotidyltransferase family protein [Chitinophaga sp. 22321]|uniref:Nucleotidyltransferase family protein n=1 Tax=Chitinophaga hostae TaxID=2831022 RepID=A0ABS5J986_9BACT|nr:nucleotidyltransferase family protein [Chitinophaga hostae]MBS0031777.1 nucleotidyltransferase family protein [Chitinophaga hostae]